MRTLVAVDWSDQAFDTVRAVCRLFAHEDLTLVYAVALRPFETPSLPQRIEHRTSEDLRPSMARSAARRLDRTGFMDRQQCHLANGSTGSSTLPRSCWTRSVRRDAISWRWDLKGGDGLCK